MKKLFIKAALCIVPFFIYFGVVYYNDVFGVFHYENIRITDAGQNSNYIKTRYASEHPDKFNAFILGSSRVGNLPPDGLPQVDADGEELRWYNMTYAMGCPKDNLETVRSLLDNGVDVRFVVVGIDEISMYNGYEENSREPMSKQYQEYVKSPLRFYYYYMNVKPEWSLLAQVMNQDAEDEENAVLFYEYGVDKRNLDITEPQESAKMISSLGCGHYYEERLESEPVRALADLKELCDERGIELRVFTSPVLQTTYEEAVSKGYLDFLADAATVVDYYNFSGLNKYTTDMKYYFDASHYKPYVGLLIEKAIFADDSEAGADGSTDGVNDDAVDADDICADVREFGAHITADNVDELVEYLEGQ